MLFHQGVLLCPAALDLLAFAWSHHKMLVNKAMSIVDINKKRKFAAEQFSLPTSKHQCWNRSLPSRTPISSRNLNGDDLAEGKSATLTAGLGPETKSADESYEGDPQSMMPEQTTEYRADGMKVLQSGYGSRSQDSCDASLNAVMVAAAHEELVYNDGDVKALKNYDDALLEFVSQPFGDDLYSAVGYSKLDQDQNKETEENPGAANAILYTLSSGSWKSNKEGQRISSRKPTIDQEFEEYFSNLML